MKILILDEQQELANAVSMNTEARGHSTVSFASAKQALKAIHGFDVLITHYDMREMTGLEVARQAYAQGRRGALLLTSGPPTINGRAIEHPLLRMVLCKPCL
jgi:CheY-like chemotaxis protein